MMSSIEDEVGPAIQCERTQHLRNRMTRRLVDKIHWQYILEVMDSLCINLTIFMDAVSCEDLERTANSQIRYERILAFGACTSQSR